MENNEVINNDNLNSEASAQDESLNSVDNVDKSIDNDANNEVENDNKQEEIMIPQSRFNEVLTKRDALAKELEEMKAKADNSDNNNDVDSEEGETFNADTVKDKLEANTKEIEKIEAENSVTNERINELEALFSQMVTEKLETIPDEYLEIVPAGDDATTLQWIYKAEALNLFGEDKTEIPIGKKTNGVGKAIVEQVSNVTGSIGLLSQAYRSRNY